MYKRLICLLVIMAFTATALADDEFPAPYRGDTTSMMAQWNFDNSNIWVMPDVSSGNPYVPYASFQGGVLAYPMWETIPAMWMPSFAGRTGVWDIGDTGFWLDNFVDQKTFKDIRIQVTYWAGGNPPEGMNVWGESEQGGVYTESWDTYDWTGVGVTDPWGSHYVANPPVASIDHGDGWITTAWDHTIEPNPWGEWIGFGNWWSIHASPSDGSDIQHMYIDQVVIDTISYPEPATVALLGLGSLALIRRKRKK